MNGNKQKPQGKMLEGKEAIAAAQCETWADCICMPKMLSISAVGRKGVKLAAPRVYFLSVQERLELLSRSLLAYAFS